jgi:hypothetical protein
MYLLQRFAWVLVAGISLLVALYGLLRFVVEVGESPLRYVVQDAALLAAGVLGMAFCWRRGKQLDAAREAGLDEVRRFTGRELEASARPARQVLALVVFGALAAGFTLMFLDQPGQWMLGMLSIFFLLLFALMVPMVMSFYRRGRPALRLDHRGVDHVWFGQVPWTDVHGIFYKKVTVKHTTIHSLLLGVSQPGRYVARMPWIARLMTGKWSLPRGRFGYVEIPLNPLNKDPVQVMNAAEALRDQVSPSRLGYWYPALDDESIAVGLEIDYVGKNPDRLPEDELLQRMEALQPRIQAMTDRLVRRR